VENVDQTLNALGPNPRFALDENSFIHASTLVYDGLRDVRRAVLQKNPYNVKLITDWFDFQPIYLIQLYPTYKSVLNK
jgi:hypothetical protein